MADRKDPEEVLEDEVEGPTNRALRLFGEAGFGLLIVLGGLALVGWGILLVDDSLVGGAVMALFGLLVAAGGVWVARG